MSDISDPPADCGPKTNGQSESDTDLWFWTSTHQEAFTQQDIAWTARKRIEPNDLPDLALSLQQAAPKLKTAKIWIVPSRTQQFPSTRRKEESKHHLDKAKFIRNRPTRLIVKNPLKKKGRSNPCSTHASASRKIWKLLWRRLAFGNGVCRSSNGTLYRQQQSIAPTWKISYKNRNQLFSLRKWFLKYFKVFVYS